MTIDDIVQEILDIKEWNFQHNEQYIFNINFVSTINGDYQFAINPHEGYIEIYKLNETRRKIYFLALTEYQLSLVKKIYQNAIENSLKRL